MLEAPPPATPQQCSPRLAENQWRGHIPQRSNCSAASAAQLRFAAGLAGLLLLVFIAAIGFNLVRGHEVDCGCFDVHSAGKGRQELLNDMRWVLIRDAAMLLMVAQVLVASKESRESRVKS